MVKKNLEKKTVFVPGLGEVRFGDSRYFWPIEKDRHNNLRPIVIPKQTFPKICAPSNEQNNLFLSDVLIYMIERIGAYTTKMAVALYNSLADVLSPGRVFRQKRGDRKLLHKL